MSETELQNLIDRMGGGDENARDALLDRAGERLVKLTRKMLNGYPGLRRWEQTDDVCQNAMWRLYRSLQDVKPTSVRHFFNLAALQIRRELLDLARSHFGPHGEGANHHTDGQAADDEGGSISRTSHEPSSVEQWADFHQAVERLPVDEKEVFGLLWYDGLSKEEASQALGISLRTLKRRWQSARVILFQAMGGKSPFNES